MGPKQVEQARRKASIFLVFALPPPLRSHPTILDIPNQLYYDRELQPCANVVDRERFCQWEGLPRQVRGSHPFPLVEGAEATGLSLHHLGAWGPTLPGRVGGERVKRGRKARLRVSPDLVQGFPIIFHGVMGKDEREGNSPSFFNPEEAATVTAYLKQLLLSSSKKGRGRLSPRHVGVISPYRKQVRGPPCPSQ